MHLRGLYKWVIYIYMYKYSYNWLIGTPNPKPETLVRGESGCSGFHGFGP